MFWRLQRSLNFQQGFAKWLETHTHTHTHTLLLWHRCALVPTDVAMATSCLPALCNYMGYRDMVHSTKRCKYILRPSVLSLPSLLEKKPTCPLNLTTKHRSNLKVSLVAFVCRQQRCHWKQPQLRMIIYDCHSDGNVCRRGNVLNFCSQ